MILIGSRALHFWDINFPVRETCDWDIIGKKEDYRGTLEKVEFHSPELLNNSTVRGLFGSGLYYNGVEVCSPIGLMFIKRSHLWRDWNFDKHITHYHKHLVPLCEGLIPSESQVEWYKEREKLTKKEFPQGNPNLNQTNEDFFDDAVKKVYDHDYIHELYAYQDKPMFTRLKREGKEGKAWCEKDLWYELQPYERNWCVAEETYVIATERFLIPSFWDFPYKLAYIKALKKVCTTLCSGWFRDHAIDSYPEILELFSQEKINKVRKVLEC